MLIKAGLLCNIVERIFTSSSLFSAGIFLVCVEDLFGVFFKAEKRKFVRTEFFYVIKGFFSAYLVAEMAFILVFHICPSGMGLLHDMKIKKKSAGFPAPFL